MSSSPVRGTKNDSKIIIIRLRFGQNQSRIIESFPRVGRQADYRRWQLPVNGHVLPESHLLTLRAHNHSDAGLQSGHQNLDLSRWKVVIGGSALSQGLCKAGLENGINLYTV